MGKSSRKPQAQVTGDRYSPAVPRAHGPWWPQGPQELSGLPWDLLQGSTACPDHQVPPWGTAELAARATKHGAIADNSEEGGRESQDKQEWFCSSAARLIDLGGGEHVLHFLPSPLQRNGDLGLDLNFIQKKIISFEKEAVGLPNTLCPYSH